MYKKLAKVLYRTRTPLHEACQALDLDMQELQPEQMLVVTCDWCSIWEKPKNLTQEPDGTQYCGVCDEMHLYKYD